MNTYLPTPLIAWRFIPWLTLLATLLASPAQAEPGFASVQQFNETSRLTLRQAIGLTLQRNPLLSASQRETMALQGAAIQAGLWRNPDLGIDSEDIGGPSSIQRFTSVRLSQLIELGGKRAARVTAAALNQDLAEQDVQAKRLELIAQVADTFTDVLAGQQQLQLADDCAALAAQVADAVAKRVKAGKAAPIEESKARVALSSARIAREYAQRQLNASRKSLARLWGDSSPGFEQATGDLVTRVALPDLETLNERLKANPQWLRSAKNIEQHQAQLELAKTMRVPDITVSAGVRQYSQTDDTTAIVGIAIPIPIFDRNQGNLQQATQRVDIAIDQQQAAQLQLRGELAQAYEALLGAQNEINMLQNEILPSAKSAYEVANRGYALGKFGFLEILDAQRTLFQNQVLYIEASANYQRQLNRLERLIAGPVDATNTQAGAIDTDQVEQGVQGE